MASSPLCNLKSSFAASRPCEDGVHALELTGLWQHREAVLLYPTRVPQCPPWLRLHAMCHDLRILSLQHLLLGQNRVDPAKVTRLRPGIPHHWGVIGWQMTTSECLSLWMPLSELTPSRAVAPFALV